MRIRAGNGANDHARLTLERLDEAHASAFDAAVEAERRARLWRCASAC
jgi:hypothetical protein